MDKSKNSEQKIILNNENNYKQKNKIIQKYENEKEEDNEIIIEIEIISDKRFVNTYSPKEDVIKDVIFFIAKPLNIDLTRQESEIADLRWIDIDKASEYITFDDDRKLYLEVLDIYKNEYR